MRILSIGFGDKKKVKYEKANNAGITDISIKHGG